MKKILLSDEMDGAETDSTETDSTEADRNVSEEEEIFSEWTDCK